MDESQNMQRIERSSDGSVYAKCTQAELIAPLAPPPSSTRCVECGNFVPSKAPPIIPKLQWYVDGVCDPGNIAPFFGNTSGLEVRLKNQRTFDVHTELLEGCVALKTLKVFDCESGGDPESFFKVLARTPVQDLTLQGHVRCAFLPYLCEYLALDKLNRLQLWMGEYERGGRLDPGLEHALTKSSRLSDLEMWYTVFPDQAKFPPNLTKLALNYSAVEGVLALPANLKMLRFYWCDLANFKFDPAVLATLEELDVSGELSEAVHIQLAGALMHGKMKVLKILDSPFVTKHLRAVLLDPRCTLKKVMVCGMDLEFYRKFEARHRV